MNRRAEIRAKVIQKLREMNVAGGNVISQKIARIETDELPIVVVSIENEANELVSKSTTYCEKRAQLSIECFVDVANQDADVLLDEITAQIERTLINDMSLEDIINRLELKQTQIVLIREGHTPMWASKMTYEATYNAQLILDFQNTEDFSSNNLTLAFEPRLQA